jgi:hypothetical protein
VDHNSKIGVFIRGKKETQIHEYLASTKTKIGPTTQEMAKFARNYRSCEEARKAKREPSLING